MLLLFQSHNLNSPLLWWVIIFMSSSSRVKQFIVSSSSLTCAWPNTDITEPFSKDITDILPPFWQNKCSPFLLHCNKKNIIYLCIYLSFIFSLTQNWDNSPYNKNLPVYFHRYKKRHAYILLQICKCNTIIILSIYSSNIQ